MESGLLQLLRDRRDLRGPVPAFLFEELARLFELDTITYFCMLRGSHNIQTIARIGDTTQLLIDFYVQNGQSYIRPIKVWDRYSPTMFDTHMMISPVGKAPEGPWEGIERVPQMRGDQSPPKQSTCSPLKHCCGI